MKRVFCGFLFFLILNCSVQAEDNSRLIIPFRSDDVLIDGFLTDWKNVPALHIDPMAWGVKVGGLPKGEFSTVLFKAFWNKTGIFLSVDWRDDIWDVQQVKRSEAIYVASDGRRRNRMLLQDNLLFRLRSVNYSYTLWISPKIGDQGPYFWQRLQRGGKFLESATQVPVVTTRENNGQATIEILLSWDLLDLKPKHIKKKAFRALLTLADSDSPQMSAEGKLGGVGLLEWVGRVQLGDR